MKKTLRKKYDIRLLYVEDEKEIRETVIEILKRRVSKLYAANNGKEGLEVYKSQKPDVIITDIKMPLMSGLEMARKIKAEDDQTQIIITSAHSDANFFIDAIDIGIDQYLLKPINKQKLFASLDKCIEKVVLQNRIEQQNKYIEKLSHSVEQSPSIVVITDPSGYIEYINPRFTQVTGYTKEDITGKRSNLLKSSGNSNKVSKAIVECLIKGKEWRGEYLNTKKDGTNYWEFASISPVRNPEGDITSYVKVSEDISEIKEIENKLKTSEERYRTLITNLDEGIGIVDFGENFTFANPALNKIFGLPESESLVGKNLKEFTEANQYKLIQEQTTKRQKGKKSIYDLEIKRMDGKKRQIIVTASPQFDNQGNATETHGIFQDITERQQLLNELRVREQKYRSLVENLGEGVGIVDLKENFIFSNRAAEEIFNVPKGCLLGKNMKDFTTEEQYQEIAKQTENRKKGKKGVYEIEITWNNSEKRNIIVTATPQTDPIGNVVGTLGIFQDITDRIKLINELRDAKERAENAYKIIEQKNTKITDSIEYAQDIQKALFPSEEMLEIFFPDSFILYKTKDIVSGDFPWISFKNNINYVAAVDCTGHGVPGAFMSMLGNGLLNQAVNEHGLTKPSEILEDINNGIFTMIQSVEDSAFSDGMDLALCAIDFMNKKIEFAGAFRPLFIYRDDELIQIKGDISPIGYYFHKEIKGFTNHEFEFKEGDSIYIFSDGYAHQYGGDQGKKMGTKQFKHHLASVQGLEMKEQKKILTKRFEDWQGDNEQLDDVLIIGIKL